MMASVWNLDRVQHRQSHGLTWQGLGGPNFFLNILLYMWVLILVILFYKIILLPP